MPVSRDSRRVTVLLASHGFTRIFSILRIHANLTFSPDFRESSHQSQPKFQQILPSFSRFCRIPADSGGLRHSAIQQIHGFSNSLRFTPSTSPIFQKAPCHCPTSPQATLNGPCTELLHARNIQQHLPQIHAVSCVSTPTFRMILQFLAYPRQHFG
jgi:hypothetical protein